MKAFSSSREAKEFLVSEIVAEAQRENVSLSEIERKMLYFSETAWTLPDAMEVNDQFDRDYDQAKYEKKIARLIRNAAKRTRKESPKDFTLLMSAIRKLKKEDHYISVMVGSAGISTGPVSDQWKGGLVLAAIVVGTLIVMPQVLAHFGMWARRPDLPLSDNYTYDERLNNLVGYVWLSVIALWICGAVYSHFDRKRRFYKMFDWVTTGMLRLFGVREDD